MQSTSLDDIVPAAEVLGEFDFDFGRGNWREASKMTFKRWVCAWDRTWAYAVFKRHHTQLNHLYWSSVAAGAHAKVSAALALPASLIGGVFPIPSANSARMNFQVNQWTGHFDEFENWTRLSALMSLAGYFETFVHNIALLALKSDPGVLISSSQTTDGISLEKAERSPDISPILRKLTDGTWSARCSAYEKLFAIIPPVLQRNIGNLEKMQKLRNGVGHSFGRYITDYRDPLQKLPLPLERLSEALLQKWLGVVDDCAIAIEEHLRTKHIGAFEVLWSYHKWDKEYLMAQRTEEQAFRATFPDAQGNPPKASYFHEAIRYYKKA